MSGEGSADRTGHVLGGYRLERLIAVGATATVWCARHADRGFEAVVKVHEAELAEGRDPASRERFLREATALAQVRHENVVELYEVGETELGEPFLIMEHLEGEALDERLSRGRPSVAEAMEIGLGVLAGLSAVHEAGVIHRDVKPENVFLAHGTRVRLLDFGLARGLTPTPGKKLTRAGAAVGTPGYMSPEQARGRSDLDVRADLYSVGIVLYEMLAGRVPFQGQTATDTMVRVCTEEPVSIAALRPDLDPALATLIMRAISRDREGRFESASSMRDAIAVIADAHRARDEKDTEVALPAVQLSPRERVPTPDPK